MEHPPYSFDLAPNGFWLFPKINSALKLQRFQELKSSNKKYGNDPVAASMSEVNICSREVLRK
jgi:hypothetical protein